MRAYTKKDVREAKKDTRTLMQKRNNGKKARKRWTRESPKALIPVVNITGEEEDFFSSLDCWNKNSAYPYI